MTIIEKKSERKKKAIKLLVESGEYSVAYAYMLIEELNDSGKLLDNDYEELYAWLEQKEIENIYVENGEETVEEE